MYQYFIPFCGCIIVHCLGIPHLFIICQLMVMLVSPPYCLWRIMLLWTLVYKLLSENVFSILFDIYWGALLLGCVGMLFNLVRNCWSVLHRGYTISPPALYETFSFSILLPIFVFRFWIFIVIILVGMKWYIIVVLKFP